MVILNFILLIFISFCATAQAEKCDVGVDGCLWTCKQATLAPGQATCMAIPATPKSCEIGSSVSICGTTCTCSQAPTCKIGENGCSWNCKSAPLKPGQATCLALPIKPETCVVGSSVTTCGTTCTCSQAPTCKIGENGCSWNCKSAPLKPGQATCLALPIQPETCVVGSSVTRCGTTCTCSASSPRCSCGSR
ncbi:keratin-associated protein 10-7-like isoform X2 [Bradysia coprophila]|uniref:keratin-associated protein 10-7-like isoform X2 n=1 Tax=Bradysia coprophila TaxID=38358 RepID=UPI00187D72A6|nr:keratin-associated protein 10-7-like isoform X2 [Bradysia coprophila]